MSDRLDQLDYYTLLGVADDASVTEIKRAFRAFARRYHPDRFAGEPDEKLVYATRVYSRGAEGLSVLTDATLRAAYDEALKGGTVRLTSEAREAAERQHRKPEPASAQTPIRTLAAQTLFKHAVEASKREDWATAWKSLRGALAVEPDNDFLQTRFAQLDAKLRAQR